MNLPSQYDKEYYNDDKLTDADKLFIHQSELQNNLTAPEDKKDHEIAINYYKEKLASFKKRTWHYIQKPYEYEITCDKCNGRNIEWSEYEGKIWCYDCQIDTKGTEGVFSGPIPIQCAAVLGMSFDRWDMINKCVLTYNSELQKYVPKELKNG